MAKEAWQVDAVVLRLNEEHLTSNCLKGATRTQHQPRTCYEGIWDLFCCLLIYQDKMETQISLYKSLMCTLSPREFDWETNYLL